MNADKSWHKSSVVSPGLVRAMQALHGFICVHLRLSADTKLFACLIAVFLITTVEAADPRKVVRTSYPSAESKLDPAAESDEASASITGMIFDSLLQYDYLARPAKLKPRAAETLPQVNADGTVFTLKVKPGIHFTPDPAFKG